MLYNAYQDSSSGIGGVSVVSCGHIFAKKGRRIDRPMGREDYLLFYVVKGKEHFVFDREAVASEGSFVLFRPHESQRHVYKENKKGEFYYIHFNAPSDFDLFGLQSSQVYDCEPSVTVCGIFEEIISELQKKQPAYERYCASKLFTLLSVFERKTKKEVTESGKHFEKISYVIQNMNIEYHINYSLEDYAAMCSMSKYHFLRVFKEITGSSPIGYRNAIRLEYVKEQIVNTDIAISEIAENAGFTSPSYFSQAFKSRFGISPYEYRKNGKT